MTARTSTALKANWDERDPAEQSDDMIDTIHNPQSAVTFAGAVTLSAGATVANNQDIVAATSGGSDLGSTAGEWGMIYVGDSRGIQFGADQDATILHDGTSGLDVALSSANSGAFRIVQDTTEYLVANTSTSLERVEIGVPLDVEAGMDYSAGFQLFDDFIQQTLTEADTPWILNKGASGTAADPAISAQENGVVRLTTGDDDGTTAQDGSQLVCHIPVQADSGGLYFETRLHINTAIANARVNAGFTDATGLEEPYTCTGTAYAANANDAAVFLYDEAATAAGSWHACAVDSTVEDTTNDPVASGPTADTYQKLRLEVSVGGGTCTYFIDDVLVATLSGGGVTPNTNLYATIIACGDGTSSKTVDVDYITFGHTRS
jgi:hypothetical protein